MELENIDRQHRQQNIIITLLSGILVTLVFILIFDVSKHFKKQSREEYFAERKRELDFEDYKKKRYWGMINPKMSFEEYKKKLQQEKKDVDKNN